MPREKELYRDTLEGLRRIASKKYGAKMLYTSAEVADLLGYERRTIYNQAKKFGFVGGRTTLEKIALVLS